MRHSSLEFARRAKDVDAKEFDLVFATDMLNLAEWKGLAGPEFSAIPSVIYFHENQFEYPNRFPDPRDLHFGFTNFVSAAAASEVWFNSRFNRDSFFKHLRAHDARLPDFSLLPSIETLKAKSKVIYPGIMIPECDEPQKKQPDSPIHLLWSARWEHDKNPEGLQETLAELVSRKLDFRISIVGESFREIPSAFKKIESEFKQQILHFGFQPTLEDYWKVLRQTDLFLSCAHHEFYGISAMEAMAAGNIPLLPERLAYPELLSRMALRRWEPGRFLYDGQPNSLADSIVEFAQIKADNPVEFLSMQTRIGKAAAETSWSKQAQLYDDQLSAI